ncbi:MAG: F0F1 ATP synthase subunit B [Phycisphaerae bacterium]
MASWVRARRPMLAIVFLAWPGRAWAEDGKASFYPGDIGQAIAAILVFVVLLAILRKFAWGPIIEQLRYREESVQKTIDNATKRQRDAHRLLEEYKQQLARAEADAQKLVEKSRAQAARDRAELIEQSRIESEKQAAASRKAIEQARREALEQLHQHTAELAAEIAGQVIGSSLDAQTHERLVAQSLAEIRNRHQEFAS